MSIDPEEFASVISFRLLISNIEDLLEGLADYRTYSEFIQDPSGILRANLFTQAVENLKEETLQLYRNISEEIESFCRFYPGILANSDSETAGEYADYWDRTIEDPVLFRFQEISRSIYRFAQRLAAVRTRAARR